MEEVGTGLDDDSQAEVELSKVETQSRRVENKRKRGDEPNKPEERREKRRKGNLPNW
jgi:hypothetical protein